MQNLIQLLELLNDRDKTQLMKQEVDLIGIKYLRIDGLDLIHSYYERTNDNFANPTFGAPAQVVKVEKTNSGAAITILSLKDEYDAQAIELVRGMEEHEIEIVFSHIRPSYLAPKIHADGWNNWVFSGNQSFEEKLQKRKEKTKLRVFKLYKNLTKYDFNNKNILFLGCGDGEEVQSFLEFFEPKNSKITGIDQSEVGITNCLKLESEFNNLNFLQLNFVDLHKLKDQYDYIFAIGIFDRETLTFDQGKKLVTQIKENLGQGFLITTGYSFDLFSRDDYANLGFDLISSCEPKTLYTFNSNFYFVLKNNENPPILEITDEVSQNSKEFWQED